MRHPSSWTIGHPSSIWSCHLLVRCPLQEPPHKCTEVPRSARAALSLPRASLNLTPSPQSGIFSRLLASLLTADFAIASRSAFRLGDSYTLPFSRLVNHGLLFCRTSLLFRLALLLTLGDILPSPLNSWLNLSCLVALYLSDCWTWLLGSLRENSHPLVLVVGWDFPAFSSFTSLAVEREKSCLPSQRLVEPLLLLSNFTSLTVDPGSSSHIGRNPILPF